MLRQSPGLNDRFPGALASLNAQFISAQFLKLKKELNMKSIFL